MKKYHFTEPGNQDDPGDMQDYDILFKNTPFKGENLFKNSAILILINKNKIKNYKEKRNGTVLRTKSLRRSLNRLRVRTFKRN